MYVDMLFVNLNKNVYIKTTGSKAKVIQRRSVIIISHQKPPRGMVTNSLCTFLSQLINALLESMYVCIHNLFYMLS